MSSIEAGQHVCGLKKSDLNEFFLAYGREYGKEDLHDRVLIFDVVKVPSLNDKLETCNHSGKTALPSTCVETECLRLKAIDSEQVEGSGRKRHLDDAEEQQQVMNVKKSRAEYESNIDENEASDLLPQGETSSKFGNDERCTDENKEGFGFIHSDAVAIREHKIFVHATFLAIHSKYFRALFYSGLKETNSNEVRIKIRESEEQSHLKMLEAIYRPYILDNSTLDELLQILELSDKYDATYVFRKCKYLLQKWSLTIADCEKILNSIEIKQKIPCTDNLSATVRDILVNEFNPLDTNWKNEKFSDLSESMLRILLSCDSLQTQCENTVFHALMHWIVTTGYDYHCIPNETESLLSLVKFELLTIDYLHHIVQYHHIAKEMPSFSKLYLKGMTYHALPSSMKDNVIARQKTPDNTIQFTWMVTKNEIEALQNRTSGETGDESNPTCDDCLESPRFWWCGYEMQMNMSLTGDRFHGYLRAKLHLLVYCLKKRSRLPVKWLIISDDVHLAKTCVTTFSAKKNRSEHDVNIRSVRENGRFLLPQTINIGISISHDPSKL
jgi:hypothetical protein